MLTKWKGLVGNQYTILKLKPGDKESRKKWDCSVGTCEKKTRGGGRILGTINSSREGRVEVSHGR